MSDEKDNDMDLLDDEADLLTKASRHLRTCSSCRPHLKQAASPIARYALAEVERELDRELTPTEKKILAKTTAVIVSRGMAITAKAAHQSAPIIEAIEKALKEGNQLHPFTTFTPPVVGEA
jgi:predicted anti-sigma-YlaC factor YlaD